MLVAFHGCPLNCKYCLNPQALSASGVWKSLSSEELFKIVRQDDLYFRATNGRITLAVENHSRHAKRFTKITCEPAHVSQIKQQCVINVEEEGTEAAALTIAECEVGCPPPDEMPQPLTMRLDRPFGFAIRRI